MNHKKIKIKRKHIFIFFKMVFEILILILFVGSYIKIFNTLQPNILIRLVFSLIYIWFCIGMNVNFTFPLLKLIDNKINKYNY